MSIQEQQELKETFYGEAIRYMDNARECLTKAQKKDNNYQDAKYVRMACGTAYNGLLIALDCFFMLKGVHKSTAKARKSIEHYQKNIVKIDKKMAVHLDNAYKVLHLSGYYDGIKNATVIKTGFDEAYKIIETIKPSST